MKYLPLALLTLAAIGCGHNEFDVSPADVSRHKSAPASLPPDTGKTEFKKGERLPNGTIAQRDEKLVTKPDH